MLAKHPRECSKRVHPPSNPFRGYGACGPFPYLGSRVYLIPRPNLVPPWNGGAAGLTLTALVRP